MNLTVVSRHADYFLVLCHIILDLAFQTFQEGRIRFLPTYKYDIGTDDFDTSKKNRIPSYTVSQAYDLSFYLPATHLCCD